jgi:hypothetical protein
MGIGREARELSEISQAGKTIRIQVSVKRAVLLNILGIHLGHLKGCVYSFCVGTKENGPALMGWKSFLINSIPDWSKVI